MLTVACVYRTFSGNLQLGGNYDATWVQKLKRGVERHLSVPHRFVCLSNVEIEGVDVIPLTQDTWVGWWSKIELFEPGKFDGPVLYFDLDVIFAGNIDAMAGPFASLVMLRDHHPEILNSTAMWFDPSDPAFGEIYANFQAETAGTMSRYTSIMSLGDQALIADAFRGREVGVWQDLLGQEQFLPFSYSSRPNPDAVRQTLPPGTRVVYCLGNPKFPAYAHLPFIRREWI